ncbi:uncharacterized protein LOC128551019 [Mercenaria mercenaria]|uniref:uncharacterized protein LOC128551019 n=1 Tax=Mercenaria mercenaria TaxID=6596 RepID=UPI00234F939A|nr:uncharacterized protein LOC128551019 [Mercenaria mercenaria]
MAETSACSEEYREMFCERCEAKGEYAPAEGFCVTCKDYLCRTCYKYHGEYRVSHNMQTENEMPQDFCLEKCLKHSKFIKFYCETCERFACKTCKTECREIRDSDHKHAWEHLPMFMKHSEDLSRSVINHIAILKEKVENMYKIVEENKPINTDCDIKATNALSIQRYEFNAHLDAIELEFQASKQKVKLENANGILTVTKELESIKSEINKMEHDSKQLEKLGDKCRLFITTKLQNSTIETLDNRLNVLEKQNSIHVYGFKPNEIRVNAEDFGTFELSDTYRKREAKHVLDIETKFKDTVNDICLLNTSCLIAICFGQRMMKVFLPDSGGEVSSLKLSGNPLRLAAIREDQVAATLRNNRQGKIVFVSVLLNGLLKVTSEIFTYPSCRAVVHYKGKLIVSYTEPENKVVILDYTGIELQSYTFTNPFNVTLSRDQTKMYVSVDGENGVAMANMNRNAHTVYKDKDLTEPRGLTIDQDGIVYVCGMKSGNVHYLTSDLDKIGLLLGEADGIREPVCIDYHGNKKRIYVGMVKGLIKVFELRNKV